MTGQDWIDVEPFIDDVSKAQDAKDAALKLALETLVHMLTNHPLAKNHRCMGEAIAAINKAMKE